MTKEQFDAKLEVLINNMLPALREKCAQLYRSGAEDVEQYDNNFVLPKLIFVAALEYETGQYSNGMSDKEFKKHLRNLRHY